MTRPAHLFRDNRSLRSDFADDTELYHRLDCSVLNDSHELEPIGFRFPDLSVTRNGLDDANGPNDSRWVTTYDNYKPPEFRADSCVMWFHVRDVQGVVAIDGVPRRFRFYLEHVPYEDLYPHSEIRVWNETDNCRVGQPKQIASAVKKFVRTKLTLLLEEHGRVWRPGSPN